MANYWKVNETGYFFRNENTEYDRDWNVIATELDMLFLEGRADKRQTGYLLLHEEAAKMNTEERELLTLPEVFPYFLSVRTNSTINNKDFRYIVSFLRPDGTPFVNPIVIGSLIKITEERQYMFNLSQFQIVQTAKKCNAKIQTLQSRDELIDNGLATMAKIKEFAGDVQAVLDKYTNEMKVVMPDKLSVKVKQNEDGSYRVEPVLLNTRDFQVIQFDDESFEKAFDDAEEVKGNYLAKDGTKFVIDSDLQGGLKQIKQYSHLTHQEAAELIACPATKFESNVFEFDLADYAERVKEIGEYKKKSLPGVNPDLGSWLPDEGEAFSKSSDILENMGLIDDYYRSDEFIDEAYKKIIEARKYDKNTIKINNKAIDLTPAFVDFITRKIDALEKRKQVAPITEGSPAKGIKEQDVLIIEDNFSVLGYTAKKQNAAINRFSETQEVNENNICSGLSDNIKLYQHQIEGIQWMLNCWKEGHKGVLLADDMGLGKTMQALAFISGRKNVAKNLFKKSILIVAPVSLLENWQTEIKKFVKPGIFDNVIKLYESGITKYKKQGILDLHEIEENHVVLTTYETLRTYQLYMGKIEWGVMVIDEAQRIKDPTTRLSLAVKAMNYDFAIALSGTPVENSWVDLWSIMDFVVPGKLGSLTDFNKNYQSRLKKFKNDNDELSKLGTQLKNDLEPVFKRRLKKDYLAELPNKEIKKFPDIMPPKQMEAYKAVIEKAKDTQKKIGKKNMLQVIAELRDVSLFPGLSLYNEIALANMDVNSILNSSARLKRTFQILMNVKAANEKALIFVVSKKMQRLLVRLINEIFAIKVETPINGEVQSAQRQHYIDHFCQSKGFNVLILSPYAAGVGFNITAANHVIHLSRCWNPAKEDQATDRAFRIGQNKNVKVYLPMSMHPSFGEGRSFDERLDKLLDFKRDLSDSVIYPTGDDQDDVLKMYGAIVGESNTLQTSNEKKKIYWNIDDMSLLEGTMFERVITDLYNNMPGYQATKTPDSNDHGADVVVYCDSGNKKGVLIQCKVTSTDKRIGKTAVEEIYGAIPMYNKEHNKNFEGVVVTNGIGFTAEAINKAKNCRIKLIARDELGKLLRKYPTERCF